MTFLDCVALDNNTQSKEESKSQKARLRKLYGTIVDFYFMRKKKEPGKTIFTARAR